MAGCTLFGKKKPDAQQPPPPLPPQTAATVAPGGNAKTGPFSTTSNPKAPLPNASGMLAGRVICSYDRQPPPTLIQVSATGEKQEGKPQEISTDTEGYFTIQGLVPGQGYQLTARTRDGDVKMGGITFAIAPNPRVLIRISEDFVPQGGGSGGSSKRTDKSTGANDTSNTDAPNRTLGAPTPIGSIADNGAQRDDGSGGANARQVASRDQADRERIPLSIGAGGRGPPPTSEEYGSNPPVTARIPSCVKTDWELENFALYDLAGMPWEYRNHKGKLVLLDFWGTWCPYCVKGIPHLETLHVKYAKDGLEIIGIAYEQPNTALEQAKLVQGVRDRLKIPYRILMGSNSYACPVKTQFHVTSFPYLVLIDEHNRIIWKKDHALSEVEKRDLEQLIRQNLYGR